MIEINLLVRRVSKKNEWRWFKKKHSAFNINEYPFAIHILLIISIILWSCNHCKGSPHSLSQSNFYPTLYNHILIGFTEKLYRCLILSVSGILVMKFEEVCPFKVVQSLHCSPNNRSAFLAAKNWMNRRILSIEPLSDIL